MCIFFFSDSELYVCIHLFSSFSPKFQDIDDEKKTVAELIVDHQDESASLEVGHQLDDQNRISPKIK